MKRKAMMARIRTALEAKNDGTPAQSGGIAERLANPPQHPRPAFAKLEGQEREARLVRSLESQGADIIRVPDLAALPAAVEIFLSSIDPKPHLVLGEDEILAALPWPVPPERWTPGQSLGDGYAAITRAFAAVAETGTLVLSSSAASPASLAFLPELHLVALARETIVSSFEDAFARLTSDFGTHRPPRAVNLISSPSRTSDIGGRSVRGAHGPRRLAVILYGTPE